jgi:hypothetical protein
MFLSNSELYSSFHYLNVVASQFKHDLNTGRKRKEIEINHDADFHFLNFAKKNSLRNASFNLLSNDFRNEKGRRERRKFVEKLFVK